ncbi:hypothetical protein PS918_02222 [Pseudomonas fluorescens]|uniref:Uncharacterized protein n=1 Tax=Pseudomonas fluorescens TaxID=294 RepID=A0A5E7S0C9_PSEFL|nr:hypothetical protein PS918_02222 [Pseudomonas fluorescens]
MFMCMSAVRIRNGLKLWRRKKSDPPVGASTLAMVANDDAY